MEKEQRRPDKLQQQEWRTNNRVKKQIEQIDWSLYDMKKICFKEIL